MISLAAMVIVIIFMAAIGGVVVAGGCDDRDFVLEAALGFDLEFVRPGGLHLLLKSLTGCDHQVVYVVVVVA